MEKYEQLGLVGEGSYGIVMKCRHKELDQVVAIKKFLETEEDLTIRRMALREIRMLKKLRHENLVTIIEVFRHKKRFYLVFEYLAGTILDEMERVKGSLGDEVCRERIFQVLRAVSYCHSNNIIHRDVKPENVLVSSLGVVKLCDFGFARILNSVGEPCTEYVATRWYRAPELLVGDVNYGPPIDIWAIGCLFAEIMTGDPIFPGESDIDQLYLIVKMMGKPCGRHQVYMLKNSQMRGMIKSAAIDSSLLYETYSSWHDFALDFLTCCLKMDPQNRSTCEDLIKHPFFLHDKFPQKFLPALREKVEAEFNSNPLTRKYKTEILQSTDKHSESMKTKRFLLNDQIRWKNNEGSGRKKTADAVTSDAQPPPKNHQKHNGQKQHKSRNSQSKEKLVQTTPTPKFATQNASNTAEIQMLEKSLESLARFQRSTENNDLVRRHCSAEKPETNGFLPPSPPQFQSLQANFMSSSGQMKAISSPNVLHPSINNITFSKDSTKLSPSSFNVKPPPTFGQGRSQFLKKLERNVVVDTNFVTGDGSTVPPPPPGWLSNLASGLQRKKEHKAKSDDFTLPNLPGVTSTPSKSRKKAFGDLVHPNASVSPSIQSPSSQNSSPSKNTSNFPFV